MVTFRKQSYLGGEIWEQNRDEFLFRIFLLETANPYQGIFCDILETSGHVFVHIVNFEYPREMTPQF